MKLSLGLKIGACIIGAISSVTLISLHPINVSWIGVSAAIYFAGEYFQKAGK